VTSPLSRCRDTAGAIAAAAGGVPLAVDERWVELDYGELDGVPFADLPAELWAAWRADIEWCPPGGESLAALGRRVRAGAESLADQARERDVVVVSHVSPIKAAVAWALGVGDEITWRMWVAPASITRIGCSGPAPSLRSFNELAHLD
jgi:broad specificity phosphatase PhoE